MNRYTAENPPHLGRTLDLGSGGLEYFAQLLPALEALGRAGVVSIDRLRARYDEQRDIVLSDLRDDARTLRRLADDLELHVGDQQKTVDRLGVAWEGTAGLAAGSAVVSAVGHGACLQQVVADLASALESAVGTIASAVRVKAETFAAFEGRTIDGQAPDHVAAIVANGPGGVGGDERARWLHERFVPEAETDLSTALRACDDADDAVATALAAVVATFDRVEGLGGTLDHDSRRLLGSADRDSVAGGVADLAEVGADLVAAGRALAIATGELTVAAMGLVAAGLDAATGTVEEAAAQARASEGPTHPDGPQNPPLRADGADRTEGVADLPPAAAPAPPAAEASAPEPPVSSNDRETAHPIPPVQHEGAGAAVVAGVPAARKRAESAGPARSATTPEETEEGGDGVVLAEAGPL